MAKFDASILMTGVPIYLFNLSLIWKYFVSYDFIYLALLLKLALLVCFTVNRLNKSPHKLLTPKITLSNFLTLLFMVYFFAIAKIPNFLFTRYFITLQPLLALIIIFDLAVVYDFFSGYRTSVMIRTGMLVIFIGFIVFNISTNREDIEGHVYELFHQNKGPLDYVIPFIQHKYKDTEHLVIATNYEETSFMYYLNAKVIIGFVGNNLEEDSHAIPDIIIYRSSWGNFTDRFEAFLEARQYVRISFPGVDYPTNNIPELMKWLPKFAHRFRTEETWDEGKKVDIYLRM
jgi:hypothetical protein